MNITSLSSAQAAITENRSLSKREKQVLCMISDDLSSKQIADRLHISAKTIEFHRARIKGKLNTNGIAGIVRYAIRTGLVQP